MSSQVLTPQQELAFEVWVGLLRGHAAAKRSLSAELLEQHGLTISDYETLLLLSRADNNLMRRVDLSEKLLLTPSGVTRLLDGLESAGLVKKSSCKNDARVTYAVLTDAGRSKLEAASCSHIQAVRELFEERFDASELAEFSDLLTRLQDDPIKTAKKATG